MQYTVKSGDTLSKIGKQLGVDWRKITGYRSGNPNLIYAGEILNIPDTTQPTAPTSSSQPMAPSQPTMSVADQLIKTAVDSYTNLANKYQEKIKQFDQTNPFNWDKILEEESAKVSQRLDPYYTQTLSDFLQGVTTKRTRSVEDERNLLTELASDTEAYTGSAKIALDSALEKSREGFADAGLYGSGQQLRETGQIQEESGRNLANYLRKAETRESQVKLGTQRTTEDLALQERMKRRELTTEQSYQTTSQALSESLRRQQQREYEKAQFTGLPPGVSPTQFSNFSYNLLA